MPTATLPAVIDVHAAVKIAVAFFNEAFSTAGFKNVQLEEVERSKDGKWWLITLGYNDPSLGNVVSVNSLFDPRAAKLRAKELRNYKVVSVNARTAEVASVKIRE